MHAKLYTLLCAQNSDGRFGGNELGSFECLGYKHSNVSLRSVHVGLSQDIIPKTASWLSTTLLTNPHSKASGAYMLIARKLLVANLVTETSITYLRPVKQSSRTRLLLPMTLGRRWRDPTSAASPTSTSLTQKKESFAQ